VILLLDVITVVTQAWVGRLVEVLVSFYPDWEDGRAAIQVQIHDKITVQSHVYFRTLDGLGSCFGRGLGEATLAGDAWDVVLAYRGTNKLAIVRAFQYATTRYMSVW